MAASDQITTSAFRLSRQASDETVGPADQQAVIVTGHLPDWKAARPARRWTVISRAHPGQSLGRLRGMARESAPPPCLQLTGVASLAARRQRESLSTQLELSGHALAVFSTPWLTQGGILVPIVMMLIRISRVRLGMFRPQALQS